MKLLNKLMLKHRINKRLDSDGTKVNCEYLVFVNDFEPRSFSLRDELRDYLQMFCNNNSISKLQIYRVETFSL